VGCHASCHVPPLGTTMRRALPAGLGAEQLPNPSWWFVSTPLLPNALYMHTHGKQAPHSSSWRQLPPPPSRQLPLATTTKTMWCAANHVLQSTGTEHQLHTGIHSPGQTSQVGIGLTEQVQQQQQQG
jgi:hypothetical protein